MTLGEAALACGVSASTVRRWADTGRIAVVRTSGGHRRFPVAELRRLNGEAAARPSVRAVVLPADALPALEALLLSASGELSAAVTRNLYDGSTQGWFGSVPGREQLAHWSRAVATATQGTDYDGALDATRRLVTHADLAGASLLERHTFLERYGDAVVRTLQDRGALARRARRRAPCLRAPAPRHPRGDRRASRNLSRLDAAPALTFAWR